MGYYGDYGRDDGAYLRRDCHVVCRDLQLPTCRGRCGMMPEGEEVLEHASQVAEPVAGRSRPQLPVC